MWTMKWWLPEGMGWGKGTLGKGGSGNQTLGAEHVTEYAGIILQCRTPEIHVINQSDLNTFNNNKKFVCTSVRTEAKSRT